MVMLWHTFSADTLEDFAYSPFTVGSFFRYFTDMTQNSYLAKINEKYEVYQDDVEGAYAKLGNGTYSLMESKASLVHLMRSRFTNK